MYFKQNNDVYRKLIRWLKNGLLSFVGIMAVLAWLFPSLWFCKTVAFSSLKPIDSRVYVSPYLNDKDYALLSRVIFRSERRVSHFFKGKESNPTIIVCTTQKEYSKYCSGYEGAGCSVAAPWGESFIILSREGLNVDVLSHEMSHAELVEKLGWWKTNWEIPQWFNEGLALMLDRRFVNVSTPEARYEGYHDRWMLEYSKYDSPDQLDQMISMRGFFNRGEGGVMYAYMSAGLEVSYWLATMNPEGLPYFFELNKRGKSFKESYAEAEKACMQARKSSLVVNPLRKRDVE
jgi:hypothetical protein